MIRASIHVDSLTENVAAYISWRGVALVRDSWLFAGAGHGGERAAATYTLIDSADPKGMDPQARLCNLVARTSDVQASRLPGLLSWECGVRS